MKLRSLLALALALVAGVVVWVSRGSEENPRLFTAAGSAHASKTTTPARDSKAVPDDTAVVAARRAAPLFQAFREWHARYISSGKKPAGIAEGVALGRQRSTAMAELMQRDPEAALREAVTLDVWESLPPELRPLVEEPFSALGDVAVRPVCRVGAEEQPPVENTHAIIKAQIDGETLRSFTFGRRLALDTKERTPVQGIRLGEEAVLRPEVLHALEPREIAVAEAAHPTANPHPTLDFATGEPLGPRPVIALGGGMIFRFASAENLATLNRQLATLDQDPGPHSGAGVIFLPSPAGAAPAAGFDFEAAQQQSAAMASAWTETKKRVFFLRVDFSDQPHASNPVVDAETLGSVLNVPVADDIRSMSYGKTWVEATVSDEITRMPQAATFYSPVDGDGGSKNDQLYTEAKSAYLAAHPGFAFGQYDIIGVWFVNIGMKNRGIAYAGLAGGSQLWLQGTTSAEVLIHEFGHNYGLGHASFWKRGGGSTNPVDPAGSNDEYGDIFDIMGGGQVGAGHFHMESKQRLNWLADGEWTDVSASGPGTYSVARIDDRFTVGVRGLRITKGSDEYYWVGYRRGFPANPYLPGGAYIVWQRPGQSRSWLIDLTPGSLASDKDDSSLAIGRTYADAAAQVFITPVGRSGTAPNEQLDIQVNRGPFPGNAAPSVTLDGPASIDARRTAFFTATASDPNGDTLAYAWDFGGGFSFDNHPSAPFAWAVGGAYTVRVTVSDMKGQSATATKVVTVNDPIRTWIDRVNSAGGDFNAVAAGGGQVVAAGQDYAAFRGSWARSTNGVNWTSGTLGSNQHVNGLTHDGTQFIGVGRNYDFGIPAWVGSILTSPDGTAWTSRLTAGPVLNAVATDGFIRVAVGEQGAIIRSTDGVIWVAVVSGATKHLAGVAYGGGRFVATGFDGLSGSALVLTSPDGLVWSDASVGASVASWQDMRKIAWLSDRFVASGWYSGVRHSTDLGDSFQTTRPRGEDTPALAYGNGVYLAAGVDRDAGTIDTDLVSTDGENWTPLPTPAQPDRAAAVFFQNTFITVGAGHSIRQSGIIGSAAVGFITWRDAHFPDHEEGSLAGDDYEDDGAPNLLEYALGRLPTLGSGPDGAQGLPAAEVKIDAPLLADRIALRLDLPIPASGDMTYVVEASSDLVGGGWSPLATKIGAGAWTWNAGGTARILPGAIIGGRQTIYVGDAMTLSEPRRFLRLRVFSTP